MAKTICDNCIHDGVCGLEGHLDEALTFCANKSTGVPMKRGHWYHNTSKYVSELDAYFIQACCSCCNKYSDRVDQYTKIMSNETCSHCGADMRNDSNLMETEVEGLFLNFEQGENND